MTPARASLLALLMILAVAPARAGGLACMAGAALDADRPEAPIQRLRDAGPPGLERLLALLAERGRSLDSLTPREAQALDGVCAMRDCAFSRLYWHTDFDAAKAAARREGKPILSLRLLGRLDEEMSCANSRFFRTVLYPDEEVGRRLRERFVLHWRSVRPVPIVTIDLGNGRKLEAPVTGNSIHYVLDARGRLIEAIPGLYAPPVFAEILDRAAADAARLVHLSDSDFGFAIRRRSAGLERELEAGLRHDAAHARSLAERPAELRGDSRAILSPTPGVLMDRVRAGVNTMAKIAFENPIIAAFDAPSAAPGPWHQVAPAYLERSRLGTATRALVTRKQGITDRAEAARMIARLERDIARDTVFNQYRYRRTLLGWLAREPVVDALEELNRRVYAELFDAPPDDPWAGFSPRQTFAALPAGGRSESR